MSAGANSAFDFSIHSTIFLEVFREDADGTLQVSSGSAFLLGFTAKQKTERYLITCQHVIEGAKRIILYFLEETHDKKFVRIPVTLEAPEAYFVHINDPTIDLACCNISRIETVLVSANRKPHYFLFHDGQFPDETNIEKMDSVEEVYYFGYPKGVYDRYNFTPIARKGITASPYRLDFDGRPCFIIDGQIYAGSSGSPVILVHRRIQNVEGVLKQVACGVTFLGMLIEGMRFHSLLFKKDGTLLQEEEKYFEQPLGLGVVIKARCIQNFLADLQAA